MPFAERRKYPRVCEAVPCRVAIGTETLPAQTRNLSCGGAMCRLLKPVEPMTQLEISLELPSVGNSNGVPSLKRIRCTGVVIRQTKTTGQGAVGYETAIYFSEIRAEDRRKIGEFVLRSMLEHDRRRP